LKGTRFKIIIREFLGNFHREIKIAYTPIPKDKKWVFLVGCYNSGTTLLAEILGHHPKISALPTEGHFITEQFIKDYEIGLPRMWVDREDIFRMDENSVGPDVIRLKKQWAIRLDCSKPVLLEKSPPNSAKTRWLQKTFENSYFIGIIRNPYAVAEGITRKADPKHLTNRWPIEKSAYQWARSNKVLYDDSRYLDRFMWIKYEDLTENLSESLNKITDFIGISEFKIIEDGKSWAIHERNDKIRNLNQESIKNLQQPDIDKITDIAKDMMTKFGYKPM